MEYINSHITLKLNKETCVGCGLCETVCPHRVFRVVERKAEIVKLKSCIECGACMSNCPVQAIDVEAGVGCAIAVLASDKKKSRLKWMK